MNAEMNVRIPDPAWVNGAVCYMGHHKPYAFKKMGDHYHVKIGGETKSFHYRSIQLSEKEQAFWKGPKPNFEAEVKALGY